MKSVSRPRVLVCALLCLCSLEIKAHSSSHGPVKKSGSDLCHTDDSPYYNQLRHYKQYPNLRACLESGAVTWDNKRSLSHVELPYHRSRFGSGWADTSNSCQNIRNSILSKLSVVPVKYESSNQCLVKQGKWYGFYSGADIYQASQIDIDHIVPLKWAWDRGAKSWAYEQRVEFANDLSNLVVSSPAANRSKGSKGISQWLPSVNQCQYILRFIRVARKYRLEPSPEEKAQHNNLQELYCKK